MTNHAHRLILVVPEAKVAAIVAWFQANIGVNSVPANLGPGLSPSGAAPATYHWCCGSWTEPECREILKRFAQLAGVTLLTNTQWTASTGAQKRTWLASVRNSIWLTYGVWIMMADNQSQWDDVTAVLAARGLKTIGGATP